MGPILDYLSAHPLIALLLLVLLISAVVTIIKKFFKIAVVLALLFILSGGAVYHFATDAAVKIMHRVERKVRSEYDRVIGFGGDTVKTADSTKHGTSRTRATRKRTPVR